MGDRLQRGVMHAAGWTALGLGAALAAREIVKLSRRFELRGRVALVTGGSRGLGLVLARRLVREGCRVAVCARDSAELDRAREDIERLTGGRGAGVGLYPVVCDVTDAGEVRELVQEVEGVLGPIDVLVNNAGVIMMGPAESMTVEDYERTMRTHFWGPLHAMLAVLPGMKARRSGRIVNVASIGGKVPFPHLAPYSASKFALVGLSGALRAELVRDGVYVTTVCPGLLRTGSHMNAEFKGRHRAEYAWFVGAQAAPGGAVAAERAAARIVRALVRGEAEVVIGVAAAVASKLYGLSPELGADALSLVNRLLPGMSGDGGIGEAAARGWESGSAWTGAAARASGMTGAAERNNEVG